MQEHKASLGLGSKSVRFTLGHVWENFCFKKFKSISTSSCYLNRSNFTSSSLKKKARGQFHEIFKAPQMML
jgi:hypothetical protein